MAALLAQQNEVTAVDISAEKVEMIKDSLGTCHFLFDLCGYTS